MPTSGLTLRGGAYLEQNRLANCRKITLSEEVATRLSWFERIKAFFNFASVREEKVFLTRLWQLQHMDPQSENEVLPLCFELSTMVASGNEIRCEGKEMNGRYVFALTVCDTLTGEKISLYDGHEIQGLQNQALSEVRMVADSADSADTAMRSNPRVHNVPGRLSLDAAVTGINALLGTEYSNRFQDSSLLLCATPKPVNGAKTRQTEITSTDFIGLEANNDAAPQRAGVDAAGHSKGGHSDLEKAAQKFRITLNADGTLPQSSQTQDQFDSIRLYFEYLVTNRTDLFIYLRTHPNSINQQDESTGRTLLHCLVANGGSMTRQEVSDMLALLFNERGIDPAVKDRAGNTPIHVAAQRCEDKNWCNYLFPRLLDMALQAGFDCSIQGADGYTILHLGALYAFRNTTVAGLPYKNCPSIVAKIQTYPEQNLQKALDTVSRSGRTALNLCIQSLLFNDAMVLVEAGASISIPGRVAEDPLEQVKPIKAWLTIEIETAMQDHDLELADQLKRKRNGLTDLEAAMILARQQEALIPLVLRVARNDYGSIYRFFDCLVINEELLVKYLSTYRELINSQDEEGETLLHHAVNKGQEIGECAYAKNILEMIGSLPDTDFATKDRRGNTPVHVAAVAANDTRWRQEVMPHFVKMAVQHGFDFSTRGRNNLSIAHWAPQYAQ